MKKLSTGIGSTLGNWHDLISEIFGPGPALDKLDQEIADATKGRDEEVMIDEGQLLHALGQIQFNPNTKIPKYQRSRKMSTKKRLSIIAFYWTISALIAVFISILLPSLFSSKVPLVVNIIIGMIMGCIGVLFGMLRADRNR